MVQWSVRLHRHLLSPGNCFPVVTSIIFFLRLYVWTLAVQNRGQQQSRGAMELLLLLFLWGVGAGGAPAVVVLITVVTGEGNVH